MAYSYIILASIITTIFIGVIFMSFGVEKNDEKIAYIGLMSFCIGVGIILFSPSSNMLAVYDLERATNNLKEHREVCAGKTEIWCTIYLHPYIEDSLKWDKEVREIYKDITK